MTLLICRIQNIKQTSEYDIKETRLTDIENEVGT